MARARALVLIATIPQRRHSCERLLSELTKQSQQPDGVILYCDGYGAQDLRDDTGTAPPACSLPVLAMRSTPRLSGPGQRWLFALDALDEAALKRDDTIVNLDDDVYTLKAPDLIGALADGVEESGAAAAMGKTLVGKRAPPGKHSKGHLIYGCGCGLALRAEHLMGLREFAKEVLVAGGPDALGICGDDDALVSALLWRKGIKIKHAATGVINCAAGTQDISQTKQRLARGEKLDDQRRVIARITGWPWPGPGS